MCGIAGQFRIGRRADLSDIRAMCDQIRHRGPDDDGYHVDGPCGIGMRRLSIIDLHSGHQPISNEDDSLWVVFNGEIYNYQVLRQDLIAQGHRFKTNSDTETLLHLYEKEGTAGLSKLRGMFAFALWDARDRSVLLVRDRFGKKPLYYATQPEGLFFGSELKCLRAAGVPLDIDREAIQLYLQFTYIPDPWTPYKAIRKLPPGSWMRFHADGRIERDTYWTLPAPTSAIPAGMDEQQTAAQVRRVFDESVKLRMIADVPLGAFLSGGIDSSSVVASMALQSNEPVKTFSIGFEEASYNELPYASMLAKKYKTEHHEIVVRPDSLDLIHRISAQTDEPFGDSSCIPTYIVSGFAAQHVKVVLSGDGGDELFGGYESFFEVERMRWVDRIPGFVRSGMSLAASLLPYSAYGKNYLRAISRPTSLDRYLEINSTHFFLRKQLFEHDWLLPDDPKFLRHAFAHNLLPDDADNLSQAMYFEATAKLTSDMLVKVDRMSMAQSIEVRCPLLDHELAALAASIPHAWKIRNGAGKQILLKAMGDRLPSELIHRKKMGFGVPLNLWFRGALKSFVWDYLTGKSFESRGIASPKFVRHMLEEHQTGRRNNTHYIYTLLMLELWFRQSDAPAAATQAPQMEAWQTR